MAPSAPSPSYHFEDQMANGCESILVYDRSCRRISCVDEYDARRIAAKFIYLLRTHGLDYAGELLRCLLSIPRSFTYFGLQFHIENFGPLQLIGKGGFGMVFKAVHKLDAKEYAIKVVHSIQSTSDLESARSEVSMMARLSHKNIVQYVTSWVEYGFLPFLDQLDADNNLVSSCETSVSIKNDHRKSQTPCSSLQSEVLEILQNSDSLSSSISGQEIMLSSSQMSHQRRPRIPHRVLFIQLELCQYNLAQWIEERNMRVCTTLHVPSPLQRTADVTLDSMVPHGPARWLSDQVACAVTYLHSMKIMHRDLKPENVLICGPPLRTLSDAPCGCRPGKLRTFTTESDSGDSASSHNCYHQLVAKLCDFGLARFLQGPPYSCTPNVIRSQSQTSIYPLEAYTGEAESATPIARSPFSGSPSGTLENCSSHQWPTQLTHLTVDAQEDGLLTANLGSEIYAAPEVLTRSFYDGTSTRATYDYKADIFSMGVIFLQLFQPMQTLHELIDCLQRFTKHEEQGASSPHRSSTASETLPQEFVTCWPEESLLVARMLSDQPSQRPSALTVLCSLASTSEFPDLDTCGCGAFVSDTTEQNNDGRTIQRTFSGHRLLDLLLWKNRQLQRELEEARQRLSIYETSQAQLSTSSHPTVNPDY